MNETIRNIMERRSTRGFKLEQIKQSEIETIIECGLNAPSAMNTQNWHFTIVQNQHLIDWLNEQTKVNLPEAASERMLARFGGDENYSVFYGAPTIVLVSGEALDSYTDANCGLAAQNMCIAAQSIGIASCIIGLAQFAFSTDKAQQYMDELNIPSGYRFKYAIAFGYAAVDMQKPQRIAGKVNYIK